ncbi:MAG: DUF479 domain-containing protein [Gammaproteobacteria bacterium]|nr:MAG: DUF479 domain-containing protein [Gammaproteobacteria bacterium]
MNFLAHLLLSGSDGDLRAGGFLGDFVRGPLTGQRPATIEAGIALHRHVDASSDRAPPVRAAVALFPRPWRRWAPVALDVLFDHYLARDFGRWQQEPLPRFADHCYGQLHARRVHFTDPALRFLDRMTEVDLLVAYAEPASVGRALGHLSKRARRSNPLDDMASTLIDLEAPLHAAFMELLPSLQATASAWRAGGVKACRESERPSR